MKVSAPGNHKPPAQAPEPGRGSTGRPSLLTFVLTNPEKSGIIIGSGALAAPIPQPKGGTALIMGQKKKVLSIGEIIWDVYPNEQCIGGAPLNFAAHCAACGCESWLLSAVGADARGAEALERARKFGIRTDWIQSLPDKLTGQCLVTLDERRVPTYRILPDAAYDNIALHETDLDRIRAEHIDVLYFGTLIQRSPISRSAVSAVLEGCGFPEVFCDLNLRPDCYGKDSVSLCLRNATILKISDEDERLLRAFGLYSCISEEPEAIVRAIAHRYGNLNVILLTCGNKGAYAYDCRTQESVFQNIVPAPVVSTVGAGDSFGAAWLAAYLNRAPLSLCMKKAAERSAFVVSHKEAVPEE